MRSCRSFRGSSLLLAAMLVSTPLAAQAPQHVAGHSGTPPQLALFTRLAGVWEGEARISMGPQMQAVSRQQETVEAVAGGTAFSIKGLGRTKGEDGVERITHDAFAVVYLDHDKVTPRMRAFVALGANWLDPEFTLTATGYTWRMKDPRAGLIRYDMSFDAQGRWVETGVMSRDDGKTWIPFFEMTLTKMK